MISDYLSNLPISGLESPAVSQYSQTYTASGNCVLGGGAVETIVCNRFGSGNAVLGNRAFANVGLYYHSDGSKITTGGSADYELITDATTNYEASGNCVVGGECSVGLRLADAGSGICAFGGECLVNIKYNYSATGGLVCSATSDIITTYVYPSSGNCVFGGSSGVAIRFEYAAGGLVEFGGVGNSGLSVGYAANGGLIMNGDVSTHVGLAYGGGGNAVIGGGFVVKGEIDGDLIVDGLTGILNVSCALAGDINNLVAVSLLDEPITDDLIGSLFVDHVDTGEDLTGNLFVMSSLIGDLS